MNKTRLVAIPTTLILALGLAGCQQPLTREQVGAGTGAVLGGILGSQFGKGSGKTAATIGGAVIGGLVGGGIGRNMDQRSRAQAQQAMQKNSASSWQSGDTHYRVGRVYNCKDKMCRTIIRTSDGMRVKETFYCVKLRDNGTCRTWRFLR